MAKLLPPKGALVLRKNTIPIKAPSSSAIVKAPSSSAIVKAPSVEDPSKKLILSIYRKVLKIDKVLKNSLLVKKKDSEKKRVSKEESEFDKREKELEKQKPKGIAGIKLPSPPKLGIFDWIKNFITQTILGFIFVRLIDHLPKLLKLLPVIISAGDFIIDMSGKLLNGIVTFVDWGYKAIDGTRGFIKQIGGEGLAKNFDMLAGAIDNVLEIAMIAALATADSGSGGDLLDLGKDFFKRKGAQQAAQSAGQQVARQAGQQAAGTAARGAGLGAGAVAGIVAGAGLLSSALGEGAFQVRKVAVKPIQNLEKEYNKDKNPFTKIGRGIVLNMVRPLYGVFSTIGFLLDVVGAPFRYAIELLRFPFLSEEDKKKQAYNLAKLDSRIREDLRKALNMLTLGFAFKEQGSFGNIYGNKGAQKEMMGTMSRMAGGGKPATRDGKLVGGPTRRTLKRKKKVARTLSFTPKKIKPGATVGGEEKVQKVFPNPEKPKGFAGFLSGLFGGSSNTQPTQTDNKTKEPKKKTANPQEFIAKSNDQLGRADFFGPFFTLAYKTVLGDKPSKLDYKNVGLGLNAWMQRTFNSDAMGFAGGGEVNAAEFFKGEDYSGVIAKSVEDSVSSKVDATLRDLSKELSLKPVGRDEILQENIEKAGEGADGDSGGNGGGGVGLTVGKWGPLLDVIAAGEGGYESVNPSFTIPGLTKMTISAAWSQAQRMGRAKGGSGAMGRYQLLSDPVGRARDAGLNPDKDLFTPANQDKIAVHIIENIRKGKEWIAGKISDQNFLQGIADEWASMPNYYGKYSYSGQGGAIKADKLKAALAKVKKGGYSQQELSIGDRSNFPSEILGKTGSFGLVDPTPRSSPGVRGSYGYAADSGLDILGKTGDPIVSPVSGTLLYAETGHTSWSDDSNPNQPGRQSQHSFLIQLSKPFKYAGKNIKYAYGTHLTSLSNSVANKSGISIKSGQTIGAMGVANNVPHLHLGLLQNRAQSSESDWLSNVQVKNVLTASRFHGGPVLKTGKLLAHKGEYVIDKDSVDLFGINFIDSINKVENKSQLVAKAPSIIERLKEISGYDDGVPVPIVKRQPQIIQNIQTISDYTDYEQPYPEPEVVEVPVGVPVPIPMGGGGSSLASFGGGSIDNTDYETLEML